MLNVFGLADKKNFESVKSFTVWPKGRTVPSLYSSKFNLS